MADPVREIPGPVGPLEALWDIPADPPRAAVVLAHPLPTEGGTMHTKVVFQAAKALARLGCVVLRFNFRGVGLSAGAWDNGRGELDDYRAAVAFVAAEYPDLETWAAGFSFGSYIAMTVGADDTRVCGPARDPTGHRKTRLGPSLHHGQGTGQRICRGIRAGIGDADVPDTRPAGASAFHGDGHDDRVR